MNESSIPLRAKARDSALRLVRKAGGLQIVGSSRWRSKRLVILCYHGFSLCDEHLWNPQIYVTAPHLEARLRLLAAKEYAIVPLGEGLRRLHEGTLPRRAVAITVDDGNYDFYAVAYPILKRWNVPVTIFVATYHVFDQRPVFDVAVSYLLWKSLTPEPFPLELSLKGIKRRIEVRPDNHADLVAEIRETSRQEHWSAQRKEEWLEQLAASRHLDWEGFRKRRILALMRPREIQALDSDNADVQLHTHRHRVPLDRVLFQREIEDNRRALAECGLDTNKLTRFCYPSGEYRREILPWLTEAGIDSAVTGAAGGVSSHTPPLYPPRFILN